MYKRIRVIALCVLLVVMVTALVWYHLPIKIAESMELYCSDPAGGSLDAEFDLSISRSLFAQDKIDGTIRAGDREYVDRNVISNRKLKACSANFRGR